MDSEKVLAEYYPCRAETYEISNSPLYLYILRPIRRFRIRRSRQKFNRCDILPI